jgi:Zn-dependent peptidase ImmA (M78 family)/DNA-binding XRE family transcriptional regulator
MPSPNTAAWIGARLLDARLQARLTQKDLADRASVSQSAIALWEAGKRMPGVEELLRLARALGQEIGDFLPSDFGQQPIRAVLRAETVELEHGELATAFDEVIDNAEQMPVPEAEFAIRATDPHSAAAALLDAAAVSGPPVDVNALAERCGVRIVRLKLMDALSGAILEFEDGPVIAVNGDQGSARQRFTVAHELGHHLLRHHDRFHVDLSASTEVGEPPGHNWLHEREANEFAADLLMPAAMVRGFAVSDASPRGLAQSFDVSPIAMSYRLQNLGLSPST